MIAPGITLYLVRHGETQWNVERRFQGQGDSPLTELGRRQARSLGRILAQCSGRTPLPQFVSSPSGRARHTMEIIRETLGLPKSGYSIDERIAEVHTGSWSGLSIDEVRTHHTELWNKREADWWNVPPPGGESYADMQVRLRSWLADLTADTVAVSHGASGRVLRGLACGMSVEEIGELHSPQDCVYRLRDGEIEELRSAER